MTIKTWFNQLIIILMINPLKKAGSLSFGICMCILGHLPSLAQSFDFEEPSRLSVSINTEAEESMPLLSVDGKILFFTRSLYIENIGGKYSGHDIWTSERTGIDWKKADNKKSNLNNKNSNGVIGMNTSGDVLYLMDASSGKKVKGIYFCKRQNNVWSSPEFIPIDGIESGGFLNLYMTSDFDVLFISMKGKDTNGEEDLYVSTKSSSSQWTKPKNLGPTINTKGFEISPFLSSDKKRLYFSSNGHAGLGDADIFVSERLYGSWEAWTVPQNLGKQINSQKFDAYFSTYGDSICFFSSNRLGASADIFTAYSNSTKRRENQQKEVERLIGESKSLLSEVREGTTKSGAVTELQLVTFRESELSEASKQALTMVPSKLQSNESRVAILGSTKPEFIKSSGLFSKVIKSELIRLGVEENRIVIPSMDDTLYKNEDVQLKTSTLSKNQFVLFLVP